MKRLKKIGYSLLLVLIIAQFFRPEKNDGDITTVAHFLAETNPTENVKKILETTCFDSHSSTTTYPWCNSITPVNYWLEEHIRDAKKHLNFSKWSEYSLKKKAHKMDELHEEVEEGEMPLNSYTWTHAEANLSPIKTFAFVAWGKKVQADYKQLLNTK